LFKKHEEGDIGTGAKLDSKKLKTEIFGAGEFAISRAHSTRLFKIFGGSPNSTTPARQRALHLAIYILPAGCGRFFAIGEFSTTTPPNFAIFAIRAKLGLFSKPRG